MLKPDHRATVRKTHKVKMTRRMRRALKDRLSMSIAEYFFEDGDVERPVTRLITRADLWNVLAWYERRVIIENRWYRVLWRMLTGAPLRVIRPFQLFGLYAREKRAEKEASE